MPEGRVVGVKTPSMSGQSYATEIFFVAVDDDKAAEKLAREVSGSSSDIEIKALSRLSEANLRGLGMTEKQVKRA